MYQSPYLSPEGRLRDALLDHDQARRHESAGVSANALDADIALWLGLGGAIADLADRIRDACRRSAFANRRPEAAALAARLSEAIDDQVDTPAWRVIDAAARLGADASL
ncbi:hypothetical protein [Phenylobacterium montanum]|uniref:Uncharacterized protein n=1 Tax=Phenylobacterium montanum TaxID=2823693 RepID=A0A975FYX9_9CAUL|nr:hypothetical protein [Caulobacter sp. S6]QUD88033.1 hypothetical protein KCG34_23880 [Caulobacter sp. S6]